MALEFLLQEKHFHPLFVSNNNVFYIDPKWEMEFLSGWRLREEVIDYLMNYYNSNKNDIIKSMLVFDPLSSTRIQEHGEKITNSKYIISFASLLEIQKPRIIFPNDNDVLLFKLSL